MTTKLTPCKACGAEISTSATRCPQCGHRGPSQVSWERIAIAVIVALLVILFIEPIHWRS